MLSRLIVLIVTCIYKAIGVPTYFLASAIAVVDTNIIFFLEIRLKESMILWVASLFDKCQSELWMGDGG